MGTLTMKFGGASVGTTPALTQVISIVLQENERWDHLIVIVSALDGVTDALIEAAHLAQLSNRRGYRRIVAMIRTRHLALVDQLSLNNTERTALQADIDKLLFDMLDLFQKIAEPVVDTIEAETLDAIVGVGERMAARIVAALLRQNGLRGVAIDAPDFLITDDIFGNATPNLRETATRVQQHLLPMLEGNIIPVITGYIGATLNGKATTLGRGGSDYTASIIGVCVQAEEVWMWTDVDGMMTTDPREVAAARVIPQLSYNEVAELAYFGARIVHTRMIGPLREHNIPVRIKNVFKPQQDGTRIHHLDSPSPKGQIKAVTSIQGIGISASRSGSLAEIITLITSIMEETIGNAGDVMITAQSSTDTFICFVIPTSAGPEAGDTTLLALQQKIQDTPNLAMWMASQVSILTIIGAGLDSYPRAIANVFETLSDTPIIAISQGASHCSLSLVIQPSYMEEALSRVHALTLSSDQDNGQAPKK